MKFTTARRLIKEAKKDPTLHPAPLLEDAHAVCKEHHAKLAAGAAAEADLVKQIADLKNSESKAAQMALAQIPEGTKPEEFAARMVKHGRQGRLHVNKAKYHKGKIVPMQGVDEEGNPVSNYDTMGNTPLRGKPMLVHETEKQQPIVSVEPVV